jgi:complete genome
MDLTYSNKFKDYIVEQNDLGYPRTIYKFSNGYGASVIKFNYVYFGIGIEIAILRFDENGNWDIDYSTSITNDVIGGLNEKIRDEVLQRIFDLEKTEEEQ